VHYFWLRLINIKFNFAVVPDPPVTTLAPGKNDTVIAMNVLWLINLNVPIDQNQQPLMMKRKLPDRILTRRTQLGVVVIQQIRAGVTPVAATALEVMAVVTHQTAPGVTPVAAAIALEVTVVMVVVIQRIALGVIPVEVEVMGPEVTVRIIAEIQVTPLGGAIETVIQEVIQQVVCDVQESASCLIAMSVS
jgi:hypothetical protein